jgi:hypothetical protein
LRILENKRENREGKIGTFIAIEEKNRAKTRNNSNRPSYKGTLVY